MTPLADIGVADWINSRLARDITEPHAWSRHRS